jgi:hypothetical protein
VKRHRVLRSLTLKYRRHHRPIDPRRHLPYLHVACKQSVRGLTSPNNGTEKDRIISVRALGAVIILSTTVSSASFVNWNDAKSFLSRRVERARPHFLSNRLGLIKITLGMCDTSSQLQAPYREWSAFERARHDAKWVIERMQRFLKGSAQARWPSRLARGHLSKGAAYPSSHWTLCLERVDALSEPKKDNEMARINPPARVDAPAETQPVLEKFVNLNWLPWPQIGVNQATVNHGRAL